MGMKQRKEVKDPSVKLGWLQEEKVEILWGNIFKNTLIFQVTSEQLELRGKNFLESATEMCEVVPMGAIKRMLAGMRKAKMLWQINVGESLLQKWWKEKKLHNTHVEKK